MNRPSFFKLISRGAAAVLLWPVLLPAEELPAAKVHGLAGEYGFVSCAVLGPESEETVRGRIATMARDYGIREFMFYDWFADYSTPVRGEDWTEAFFRRMPIRRAALQAAIEEVHAQGGRAWAYVQAVAAEEENLESPAADRWKLRNGGGTWYWHPPGHARFPTYFANAAWARFMVERWAGPVKELGFDGIHWDTLGRVAGDYGAETKGLHAFIQAAYELLQRHGLRQTMNMVDLAWWDREIVKKYLEFPYVEAWSTDAEHRYYAEMDQPDMAGIHGVLAMYPSVAVPAGGSAADVIRARHNEAHQHRLVYLLVGDGARRMKNEYWPETVPLTEEENAILLNRRSTP
ncbi:MAG TPA: hypothetical protein DCZ95_10545 [Verrucomicrobia bacterium]|nr:MAG: hypothetical protein A2X46_18600 [Lentisphaerae bacterium GWF2_57_35]HBA84521.1 hypothetical protein [Verrucomicrobiota bacterium]